MGKISTVIGVIGVVKNWPTYLLEYAGVLAPAERIYELKNGLKIATRPKTGDRSTINEIFIHNLYPYKFKKDDIVVDIGAHIGIFTIFAASHAAKVFSYEPDPGNFAQLKKNLSINHLPDAAAFNIGVAGKSGK
ncbi:MAG: FkbM family methyltransferase, partial [Candidatus Micrarchaeia archaeon]